MMRLHKCITRILNMAIYLFWIGISLAILWGIALIFLFATFKIPSDSMEPQLLIGDRVLVNKLIAGPRLFNLFASLREERVDIYRLPGFGQIRRNDIVVFHSPHPYSWDRIDMHIMRYYIKRCVGLPGDTIQITNGFYVNNHAETALGNIENQKALSKKAREEFSQEVYHCFPFDSLFNWNIHTFGPLYVPRKGDIIALNRTNFQLYRQLINWELKDSIAWKDTLAYRKNTPLPRYQFRENYYFMASDNVENSQDSRYLGLIPEDFIVGVAWRVVRSIDPYTGTCRKDRFWKKLR